jgi:hypothetical protein
MRAALTANKSRYFGGDKFVRFARFGWLSREGFRDIIAT